MVDDNLHHHMIPASLIFCEHVIRGKDPKNKNIGQIKILENHLPSNMYLHQ